MANPTAAADKPLAAEMLASLPFNGTMKRLEIFGDIPGYRMQWANDEGSRIHTLLRYGFEFVKHDEVGMASRTPLEGNQAVDDKVKRPVGTLGSVPLYAYLMKCPQELWDKFQAAMQVGPDKFDHALMGGLLANRATEAMQYTPQGVNKLDDETSQRSTTGMRPKPHTMGGPNIGRR